MPMKLLLILPCILAACLAPAQKIALHNIYFDRDKCDLNDKLTTQLDSVYDKLPREGTINLGIVGSIRTEASTKKANLISDKRAHTVNDYLVSRGLKQENITIKKEPSFQNRLTTGRDNYRLDDRMYYQVIVHKPENEYIRLVKPDTTIIPELKPQYFAVYLRSGNIITGREGTVIMFTDNCFEHLDGRRVECEVVIIELREYFRNSSMLAQQLTTGSNGQPLITGGMLSIKISCNGEQLKVKENKTFEVRMPAWLENKGMQVFAGNQDGTNWDQTGRNISNVSRNSITGMAGSDGPDYYKMSFNQLGWINCDKFMDRTDTTHFFVQFTDTLQPKVLLVFTKMNSILAANALGHGKAKFERIPENEPARLLVYAEKNKRMYMYTKDITVGKIDQDVKLKEVGREEFRQKLREFD
jgi:hypothetical protein